MVADHLGEPSGDSHEEARDHDAQHRTGEGGSAMREDEASERDGAAERRGAQRRPTRTRDTAHRREPEIYFSADCDCDFSAKQYPQLSKNQDRIEVVT